VANILPDGGRGTGPNPYGSDYPFVAPSADVRHLLADAYIAHAYDAAVPPLRLTRLAGFDAAFEGVDARCDVEVRDAADVLVFDSTTASRYRSTPFGARLKVHEWYAPDVACRVVQHTAFGDAAAVVAFPAVLTPADGRLDGRVSEVMPRRVTLVGDPETGVSAAGDLVFANGYNTTMDIRAARRGLRVITQVTWAAEPGSGLGRYPGCAEPELVLRSVNKIRPADDGDFQLGAGGCYWVRRQTVASGTPRVTVPVPGTLHIGNDCGPCCECADFVAVQRAILRTWGRFVAIAGDAQAARDAFRTVVDRWKQEKACVDARVVTVALAPFGGEFVEVVVGVCNHTRECLFDTTVTLTAVTAIPGGGSIPAGATRISTIAGGLVPYQLRGVWPTLVGYFDAVQAMASGTIRTRLQVPAATPGSMITVRAAASTTSPLAGLALPQTAEATATFEE
jgi:hypothetical protein